jgi:hypothetical protein
MSEQPKVMIESVVDRRWLDFAFSDEVFSWMCCGYWARRIEWGHTDEVGWLLWESNEMAPRGAEPNRTRAIAAWSTGRSLPPFYHRLDLNAAIQAWAFGVKRWGERWYDKGDSTRYDEAIQLALFGEVRYGR